MPLGGLPRRPTWDAQKNQDKLAVTLTSSNVYTSLSRKSRLTLRPEGTKGSVKIAETPTWQASNRRASVGSCQEHLETPLMSSGRWSRPPLLPRWLSPPPDALLMCATAVHSLLPPDVTFYYPLHCFTKVYILPFFLCCHFSYFIFYFYFNSMAGSYAALVSPFCLLGPHRATRNEGLSLCIDFWLSRHWPGGSVLWCNALDVAVGIRVAVLILPLGSCDTWGC